MKLRKLTNNTDSITEVKTAIADSDVELLQKMICDRWEGIWNVVQSRKSGQVI